MLFEYLKFFFVEYLKFYFEYLKFCFEYLNFVLLVLTLNRCPLNTCLTAADYVHGFRASGGDVVVDSLGSIGYIDILSS